MIWFLSISAAARAEVKTLNTVCEDMLLVFEAYTACISGQESCTQEDFRDLKTSMINSLLGIGAMARADAAQQLVVTARQAQDLNKRILALREQLETMPAPDGGCNLAVFFITSSVALLKEGVWIVLGAPGDNTFAGAIIRGGYLFFVWVGLFEIVTSGVLCLLAILLAPSCLLLL